MKYHNVTEGKFIERPNRFISYVEINGETVVAHVKNTGRCKELLQKGAVVYLEESQNPARKTKFDLITVEKQRGNLSPLLINMDSQAPNQAAEEWLRAGGLFSPDSIIKREVTYKNSRFDFYIKDGERKIFLEVKGVTQENEGLAMFPDAPTERGVKHIQELVSCIDEGYEAYILFVIQMKEVHTLVPNDVTHKAFGDALREAKKKGVKIIAMDCIVKRDSMDIDKEVPIRL